MEIFLGVHVYVLLPSSHHTHLFIFAFFMKKLIALTNIPPLPSLPVIILLVTPCPLPLIFQPFQKSKP